MATELGESESESEGESNCEKKVKVKGVLCQEYKNSLQMASTELGLSSGIEGRSHRHRIGGVSPHCQGESQHHILCISHHHHHHHYHSECQHQHHLLCLSHCHGGVCQHFTGLNDSHRT